MESLLKFLIMENLPATGVPVSRAKLMNNVILDAMDLKKAWRLDIFEKSLIDLNERQFIFVNNEKETVTVTQYGINKHTDKD